MKKMQLICVAIASALGVSVWRDALFADQVGGFMPFAKIVLLVCFGTAHLWIPLSERTAAP